MRVALMIEGQEDVTWEDWVALADACERSGVEALFRSDHYLSVMGEGERGALDAWAVINALAARTTKLHLGTMVSPTSFRHPSVLARLVIAADHVSGGRVSLGMGTGWSEIEHSASGFPFLSMKERMDVLEEQLEIVHDGYFGDGGPFSFKGEHYELTDLKARPRPVAQPHPPLIMGGAAGPRAARLAARYADEYNTVMPTLDEIRERKANIDAACEKAGREPIPFTIMTAASVGKAHPEATETWINGSVDEVKARLDELAAVGVSGVYLQLQEHRDLEMVELIGRALS
ncbi:LLM class flavin-dependent oxidoreductase [Solirubrobacter phytolaccae]|uniref:LLM class flavin-dependent oxidoreductase n=1 Tax=Solirubrobacter phytolaccae TaxID=1404360 RepID=A0A9X3NBA2_9ACTN|nr:LLM class flavin-dependent oxidoreductase [Solirubrobacter phytolaccae]MDA0182791.1 LLM class flavin-dependent oxidoreductase [Solirubrobacter phytolaccae]